MSGDFPTTPEFPIPMTERRDYAAIDKAELCEELWRKDAEIAKLRSALRLIDDYYQTGGDLTSHMAHLAQEALDDEQKVQDTHGKD